MLETRVELKFPDDSCAPRWVELRRLRPLIDPHNVISGKIESTSYAVEELKDYRDAKRRVQGSEEIELDEDSTDNVPQDSDDTENEPFSLVKLKKDLYLAVMQVAPDPVEGDAWEVEKLRKKRLRMYHPKGDIVKNLGLRTNPEDPWVQILLRVSRVRLVFLALMLTRPSNAQVLLLTK